MTLHWLVSLPLDQVLLHFVESLELQLHVLQFDAGVAERQQRELVGMKAVLFDHPSYQAAVAAVSTDAAAAVAVADTHAVEAAGRTAAVVRLSE